MKKCNKKAVFVRETIKSSFKQTKAQFKEDLQRMDLLAKQGGPSAGQGL